jgi:hypothetical protein
MCVRSLELIVNAKKGGFRTYFVKRRRSNKSRSPAVALTVTTTTTGSSTTFSVCLYPIGAVRPCLYSRQHALVSGWNGMDRCTKLRTTISTHRHKWE